MLGGGGADDVYGDAGNDTIKGQGGDDNLYGLVGRDSILGGDGIDYIVGGRDVDYADGGDGGDEYYFVRADMVQTSNSNHIYDTVMFTSPGRETFEDPSIVDYDDVSGGPVPFDERFDQDFMTFDFVNPLRLDLILLDSFDSDLNGLEDTGVYAVTNITTGAQLAFINVIGGVDVEGNNLLVEGDDYAFVDSTFV
jgi:Ca2+-binding RTX toxin-like protein